MTKDADVAVVRDQPVTRDDDLLEAVLDLEQRALFLLPLLLRRQRQGRLDAIALAALVADEADFELRPLRRMPVIALTRSDLMPATRRFT